MKTKLYRNELGIFLFSPPREIFPVIFQRYNKELNEDIKLRYIVVLGGRWDDASILCIWLKWNLN
jgi:hypothetical protein